MKKKAGTRLPPHKELVAIYRQAVMSDVPLSKVEQKIQDLWQRSQVSEVSETSWEHDREEKLQRQLPKWVRFGALAVPMLMIGVGFLLVSSAVVPIVGYYLAELPQLQAGDLTTPIPLDRVLDANPVIVTKVQANTESTWQSQAAEPIIIDSRLDYTNLTNWFSDTAGFGSSGEIAEAKTYTIAIPSLDIADAVVTVGGSNLNKSLIQFPGTAMPGEHGSPVIFGHSVLRQFYNPSLKNPRRYNSIFSTIMTLKKGEKILITVDNVTYTYVVQDKTEVKPEDTYILAQKYDSRQLKLVTCTPEGTYLRRGVVTAVLATE